jgi:hypothetical protein
MASRSSESDGTTGPHSAGAERADWWRLGRLKTRASGDARRLLLCRALRGFLILATLWMASQAAAAEGAKWDFDASPPESMPPGFLAARTGAGKEARWVVRESADAPSGRRVLVQLDLDETSARFPLLVAERPMLRDLRVGIRCRPLSGRVDQACGVVARYRDADN